MKRIIIFGHTALKRHDFIRYLFTGGFNTGLTFVIYATGIHFGLPYFVANTIAWIVGVVVSFTLSSTFVFQKGLALRRLGPFVLLNLLSLAVSTSILTVLIKHMSFKPIAASLTTIPMIVLLNFIVGKFIIFRNKP